MKKDKKVKEIVSRPVKTNNRMNKSEKSQTKRRFASSSTPLDKRIHSRISDFNLEAEAARMAYRNGISTESGELYRIQYDSDIESEQELEPIQSLREEREITSGDREEVIEKLKKSIKSEEKEGWEAFYN